MNCKINAFGMLLLMYTCMGKVKQNNMAQGKEQHRSVLYAVSCIPHLTTRDSARQRVKSRSEF